LEHARCQALAEEFIGLGIIHRDVIQCIALLMAREDQVAGLLHDGQRGETQEIHLEHTQVIQNGHFVLGYRFDGYIFRVAGGTMQRQVIHDGPIGDDHTSRVRAHVAGYAFHAGCGIDQVLQIIRAVIQLLELRDLF
jgi:hypothetical protein